MTTTIKNGTIVTADLTYKADLQIDNGVITAIGPNLTGGTELDATGCYVMPGGIDMHCRRSDTGVIPSGARVWIHIRSATVWRERPRPVS